MQSWFDPDVDTTPPSATTIGATELSTVADENNSVQDPTGDNDITTNQEGTPSQVSKSHTFPQGGSTTDDEDSDMESSASSDDDDKKASDEAAVRKPKGRITYIEDYNKRRTRFNKDKRRLKANFDKLWKRTDCIGILYLRRWAAGSEKREY